MTPSLIGNSDAKVDAKGRAFLPASFRRLLGDEKVFYLRKGLFENYLVLYPETAWESTISELRQQLNPWVREEDMIFRQFVAEADRIELEENGRMLIPKRYLTATGIASNIRFIGRDTVIEIWPVGQVENTFIDANLFASKMEQLMKNARNNTEK
ncbi:MAG: cell division/cell wall cluster transcriptional repressor MraZ [Paludibacteraceae bacterium]|nr:cell division/cell wall cluster transcriptional repressor MraZ [Paludibacteraceae bacterium]